jgi:hypothetical protein
LKTEASCTFITIPSVVFEFTHGVDNADTYSKRVDFVSSLVDSINPVTFLNEIGDFYVVMAKSNASNRAYTDFLLAACIYKFSHTPVALLTTDLKALPPFFPRTHIISTEHQLDVVNFGVYQFDSKGYATAAQKVLTS